MVLKHNGGPPYYQFPHLADFSRLRHGVFTRHGGVSQGEFSSLNVTRGLGDPEHRVKENRDRISAALGGNRLAFIHQVHGTEVAVAEDGTDSDGADHPVADALISGAGGRMLTVQVADCQPVLLYDPVQHVSAAVHSGWRGSVEDILGRSVAVMHSRFNCHPADIVAGIGPSLGPCCAEFVNYRAEIPRELWCYRGAGDRFDFWSMSRDQLIDAGLDAGSIVVSGLCTRCRTDLFFSYRAERRTGRFAAAIGIV
jgi:YfiH family protein